MPGKKRKQTTQEQRDAEARALAWAQFGQLMHLVSMPTYPPKPEEKEGDHDDDGVRPD